MPSWSSNNFARTPVLLLAASEALILYSSVYVAAILLFGDLAHSEKVLGPLAPKAVSISTVMLISLISMGLYHFHQRINFREVLVRLIVGITIGSLALVAIFYAFPTVMLTRNLGVIAILYAFTLLLALRFFFVRNVDQNVFRRRTLVYGAGERAASISDLRRRADRRGFKVVGSVPAPGDSQISDKNGLPMQYKSLSSLAVELHADEIVIAMDDRRGNLPIRELLDCKFQGIDVIDLLEFLERETGKIRVDLVNPGWLIFTPGFRITRFRRITKRVLDLAVGVITILLTWPILLLVAIAIKFEDGMRAPVFYRQSRVGYQGELFSVLKFRSMKEDAEADGQPVWAEKNDSRVTRVGAFIRKIRLDELPQVINVLRGQMSLVGPRPERPAFVDTLSESIPYYFERHAVKPGVTGWAQLRYSYGSSKEDAIEKLQYDLYYIKNQNILLDLLIILQTAEVVFLGKGAR